MLSDVILSAGQENSLGFCLRRFASVGSVAFLTGLSEIEILAIVQLFGLENMLIHTHIHELRCIRQPVRKNRTRQIFGENRLRSVFTEHTIRG